MIFYTVAVNNIKPARQNNFVKLSIIAAFIFNLYCLFLDYDNLRFQHQERLTDDWKANSFIKTITTNISENQQINPIIEFKETSNNIHIEAKFQENINLSNPENGYYILLESDQNSYLFPSKLYWQSKKSFISRDFIFNKPIKIVGLQANISKLGIKSDTYQLKFLKIEDKNRTIQNTSQTLDIQEVKFDNSKQNW